MDGTRMTLVTIWVEGMEDGWAKSYRAHLVKQMLTGPVFSARHHTGP